MQSQENIEQTGTSFYRGISNLFKKLRPIHVICAVLPMILIYPKPLMYLLRPIIRNWSFHYRSINKISSKPIQIILTSNPNLSFQKQYINKFIVIRGTLPQSFRLIGEEIINQNEIRQNEDESMKHLLIKKKYQLQRQKILGACYVIDVKDFYLEIDKSQTNFIVNQKMIQSTSLQQKRIDNQQIYTQIDYIWVEMILMKLKLLQLENNSEVIKHVIIKANQRVLQLLEAKILGIKQSQAFKLGIVGENKIHLLKFNKSMDTYEHCSATFKIQQKELFRQD